MSKMTSPFSKLPLSFFYFFITLMPFHVISQSPATTADQTTLLNLKKLWQSPPWTASWNSSSSPCTWPEIQCTAGTVTGLLLRDKNIMGTIPPSICDLKNLTVLDLSYNYLQGDFPKVLYNCSGLQYLDLSQKFFVGSIPSDINRLSSLRFINVGGNNFSGEIPPAISRLQELRTLHLYKNQFNGTVPIEIGNLANLVTLGMAYNTMLSPSIIPIEFGNLKKQEYLWMTMTNLIGKIPDSFANLSSLQHLDLAMNNLDGPLPQGLFQLKNLSVVYLSRNSLSGEIPTPIESNLIELDMSMNNLSGQIPAIFGSLCRRGFKKGVGKFEDLRRSLKNNFEFSRRNVRGLDSSMVSTQEHKSKGDDGDKRLGKEEGKMARERIMARLSQGSPTFTLKVDNGDGKLVLSQELKNLQNSSLVKLWVGAIYRHLMM
ncbi:unnamed protein product [Camellia sinensis]